MTSNHVLGMKVVLADGTVTQFGGESLDGVGIGPDLIGLFVGSEGLFGIALEITLRLMPAPELYRTVLAAYDNLGRAGDAVSMVVASGIAARRYGDHGSTGDQGGRGIGGGRLSTRCGSAADRRAGRRGAASRSGIRAIAERHRRIRRLRNPRGQ